MKKFPIVMGLVMTIALLAILEDMAKAYSGKAIVTAVDMTTTRTWSGVSVSA